jgi:hypothetical protein
LWIPKSWTNVTGLTNLGWTKHTWASLHAWISSNWLIQWMYFFIRMRLENMLRECLWLCGSFTRRKCGLMIGQQMQFAMLVSIQRGGIISFGFFYTLGCWVKPKYYDYLYFLVSVQQLYHFFCLRMIIRSKWLRMREIMMIQTTMPLMKITMMDHNHCIPST